MTEPGAQDDDFARTIDGAIDRVKRTTKRLQVNSHGYDSLREQERHARIKQGKTYARAGCIGGLITAGVLSIPLLCIGAVHIYNSAKSYIRPSPIRENVLGNSDREEYITLNGKKYYASIDEIPLEEYFLPEPSRETD